MRRDRGTGMCWGLLAAWLVACGDSSGGETGSVMATTGESSTAGGATTSATTADDSEGTSSGATSTSSTPGPTTGAPPDNPFDDPPQCSSREYWEEEEDEGSPQMNPGEACITCHTTQDDAPTFLIAGTVYPTAHEPNDCFRSPPATDAEVVITDAMNQMFVLPVNQAGNFFLEDEDATLVLPFTAKVVLGDEERAMGTPQSVGDCNSCHTQAGANGAPGRILVP
ncbi:hypothetical protein [Nannocystis sp. SCPEA4]|uniref:hypothetical protein n=1 Tax=Nannocystis sp. SCPEA4 TaxID=2996787 RepID=UPI0022703E14|nr:hypothetical protein [Nannocystis sp. SCPEA4]MCY1054527.1 hypothetical protein [Nannocystis sp. SCPEA4]